MQNGNFVLDVLRFCVPDMPDIFWGRGGGGKQQMLGPSLHSKKNENIPPVVHPTSRT